MKLLNSFSLNMLSDFPAQPLFEEISLNEARILLQSGFESAVGHVDTAALFAEVLGMDVAPVRASLSLQKGDVVVVGQYRGTRLQEGATTLPAGATIQWIRVTI